MNINDQSTSHIPKFEEEKNVFQIRFEKSLIAVLLIFIFLFLFSRKMTWKKSGIKYISVDNISAVNIPVTSHGGIPRPPTLPQVPLPVDDEYIPQDETIEDTDLDLYEDIIRLDDYGTGRGAVAIRPRPIRDVIPEYPEKERKKGITAEVVVKLLVNSSGSVDSVQVVSNTTNNKNFEKAAKKAAYKTKYLPAKVKRENIALWIMRKYTWK